MSMGIGDVEFEDTNAAEEESSEFEQLYNQSIKSFQKGSLVKGKVLRVQSSAVLVDLGYKSDGIIPIEQFTPEELATLKPGDELEIFLEQAEDSKGNLILSREKAKNLQVWDVLNAASQNGTTLKGRVISKIKGGLMVDIGVPAFLPGSQIDIKPVKDLDQYLGQVLDLRIIKMNSGRGNIVLSRRAILEGAQNARKEGLLASLSEGQIVSGIVKNITDYGRRHRGSSRAQIRPGKAEDIPWSQAEDAGSLAVGDGKIFCRHPCAGQGDKPCGLRRFRRVGAWCRRPCTRV
jgi:small subunit ribosomal protein S1